MLGRLALYIATSVLLSGCPVTLAEKEAQNNRADPSEFSYQKLVLSGAPPSGGSIGFSDVTDIYVIYAGASSYRYSFTSSECGLTLDKSYPQALDTPLDWGIAKSLGTDQIDLCLQVEVNGNWLPAGKPARWHWTRSDNTAADKKDKPVDSRKPVEPIGGGDGDDEEIEEVPKIPLPGTFTVSTEPATESLTVRWTASQDVESYSIGLTQTNDCADLAFSAEAAPSETHVTFTNIPSGDYGSCVKAINQTGSQAMSTEPVYVRRAVSESLIYPYSRSLYEWDLTTNQNSPIYQEPDETYGRKYAMTESEGKIYFIDPMGIQVVNIETKEEVLLKSFETFTTPTDVAIHENKLYFTTDQFIFRYNLSTEELAIIYEADESWAGRLAGVSLDSTYLYAAFNGALSSVGGSFFPDSRILRMDHSGENAVDLVTACPGPNQGCSWHSSGMVGWIEDLVVVNSTLYVSDIWGAAVRSFDATSGSQLGKFKGSPFNFSFGISLTPTGNILRSGNGVLIEKCLTGSFGSVTECATYDVDLESAMHESRKVIKTDTYYIWLDVITSRIYRTNVISGDTVPLSSKRTFPGVLDALREVTYDTQSQMYYVTDGKRIYRLRSDNPEPVEIYRSSSSINSLFWNATTERLYWANYGDGDIRSSDAGGQDVRIEFSTGLTKINAAVIDRPNDLVLFAEKFVPSGFHTDNLAGSDRQNRTNILTNGSAYGLGIRRIIPHLDQNKIFIMGQDSAGIAFTDPTFSSVTTIHTKTSIGETGLASDGEQFLYFNDGSTLKRMTLDGSDVTTLGELGDSADSLRYIAGDSP